MELRRVPFSLFPSSVLTASGSKGISQFFNNGLKDTPKVEYKYRKEKRTAKFLSVKI
jgi:hypothetical protein